MTKALPKDDAVAARIGRAIAILRERKGLTQADAAANVPPKPGGEEGMTAQYFGMHENGKVRGIHRPEVQAKLLAAIGATPDELEDVLDTLGDDGAGTRLSRIARELRGGDIGPAAPATRQAIFPLPEGDVVITMPADLSPAGFKKLEDYLAVFLRPTTPARTN